MPAAEQERGGANPPAPPAADALRRDVRRNLGRNGLPTIVFGNGDAALAQAAPNPSSTTSSATAPGADRVPPAFVDNDGVLRRAESISAAELLQNMAPPPPAGFLSGSPVTGAVLPPMPPPHGADWSLPPDSFSSPQFYSGLMGLPMPTPMSPMMGLPMPMPMPTMSLGYGEPRSCWNLSRLSRMYEEPLAVYTLTTFHVVI